VWEERTEIGCESGVFVQIEKSPPELRGAEVLRLCVDGHCGEGRGRVGLGSGIGMSVQDPSEREVLVKVAFRDDSRQVLASASTRAQLVRTQPNGPDCEPTCFRAALVYDVDSGRLTPE
jgi:hypothetical protein